MDASNGGISQTIYISNLNEKINKQELRRALYGFFAQYGTVLDVVALKTPKMRGQAFVAFKDMKSAVAATKTAQGFVFLGRPLRIAYAKGKSFAVMQEEGTFAQYQAQLRQKSKPAKAPRQPKADPAALPAAAAAAAPAEPEEIPSKTLLVEHLPKQSTESMVVMLFQQIDGFVQVRMEPGRTEHAFVDFRSVQQAIMGRDQLQGFRLTPTNIMKISFVQQDKA